jgi:hypothetical protein
MCVSACVLDAMTNRCISIFEHNFVASCRQVAQVPPHHATRKLHSMLSSRNEGDEHGKARKYLRRLGGLRYYILFIDWNTPEESHSG